MLDERLTCNNNATNTETKIKLKMTSSLLSLFYSHVAVVVFKIQMFKNSKCVGLFAPMMMLASGPQLRRQRSLSSR
jgi:hypothetical protein